LLEPATLGDPMRPLAWVSKSHAKVALALRADNWLSNRIFNSFGDIIDHCCDAWNKLVDQPWKIMSIDLRDWAYEF
jgi:hypothetical protein